MVAFVPVSGADLAALVAGDVKAGPLEAYAATDALRDTFDLDPGEDEEAERTALLIAGLVALMSYGRRLVAVIDRSVACEPAGYFGEVSVPDLALSGVTALFADSDDARDAAAGIAAATAGLDLDAAWDLPVVAEFMHDHDLLWYGPEEVSILLGPG